MSATQYDFVIEQGTKFNPRLLYMQPTFTSEEILGITNAGRAVVDCPSHGLTIDWPVWIVGVVGMEQVNNKSKDIGVPARAIQARVEDGDTLKLDLDTTRFAAYESGGELLYRAPVDLTGYTARMQIRETKDSEDVLVSVTVNLGGTSGTVEPLLTAVETAELDFTTAWYDIELLPAGVEDDAFRFLEGKVTLSTEVTR